MIHSEQTENHCKRKRRDGQNCEILGKPALSGWRVGHDAREKEEQGDHNDPRKSM
jgi:hypothetical protein